MGNFLKKNDWWFYFIFACLISWTIWGSCKLLLPENLTTISLITGAFGPLLTAIIILRVKVGGSGLKEWLKTNFNFRINTIWYLSGGIILLFISKGSLGYKKEITVIEEKL